MRRSFQGLLQEQCFTTSKQLHVAIEWEASGRRVNQSIVFQQETMVARRGLAQETCGTRQDGSCNSTHAFLTNSTGKSGASQLQVLIADERVCGRN
jgi:hypothetical protein